VEIAAFLLAVISTIATVIGLFTKTDKMLGEIREILIQIRDDARRRDHST
jgi:hypothetical protein